MNTKHTPGPWYVKQNSVGGPTVGTDASVVADIRTYGGPHIGGSQHPRTEANASLIAAAPELLEALKDATEAFEDLQDKLPIKVNPMTLGKARAAIAKATGAAPEDKP